jgi:hypothetical protein
MNLDRVPHDISRESQPRIGPFEGRCVVILGFSVLAAFFVSQALLNLGFDLLSTLFFSAIPIALAALFVVTMVNGQAPSHTLDALRLLLFEAASWLYLKGFLDQPPLLLKALKPPLHPSLSRKDQI